MNKVKRGFSHNPFKDNAHFKASALLALLTFLFFWPCLRATFVFWDDPLYLTNNLTVRFLGWEGIRRIFSATVSGTYIPLSILTYAVECRFLGLNPLVYHLDNVLLHCANVILVYCLSRRLGLTLKAAFVAGLLFALHPMHVEAVAWVTSRKDVLYAFFFLISIYAYLGYVIEKKRPLYWLSLLSGLLSILAKPMALSLPLILLLCDWFLKRRGLKQLIVEKIPYCLYIIPLTWLTYKIHARVPGTQIGDSLLTWIWCLTFYLKKFLWPVPCLPLYNMPVNFAGAEFDLAVMVLLAVILGLIYFRRERLWLFSFNFFFLSVFFLLRFDIKEDLQVVSDRYMYLPSLGFCLLAGYAFERALLFLKDRDLSLKRIFYGLVCVFFVLIGSYTFRQCRLWTDEESLWKHVIKYNPTAVPYQKVGDYFFLNDLNEKALPFYNESVRLDPGNYEAWLNIATIVTHGRQYEQALKILNDVAAMAPDYPPTYVNRAVIYGSMGRYDLALEDMTRALSLDPLSDTAYVNRGNVYSYLNWLQLAVSDYNYAIKINPFAVQAYYNRGLAFARMGDLTAAEADFIQTLKLSPKHPRAWHSLGQIRKAQKIR